MTTEPIIGVFKEFSIENPMFDSRSKDKEQIGIVNDEDSLENNDNFYQEDQQNNIFRRVDSEIIHQNHQENGILHQNKFSSSEVLERIGNNNTQNEPLQVQPKLQPLGDLNREQLLNQKIINNKKLENSEKQFTPFKFLNQKLKDRDSIQEIEPKQIQIKTKIIEQSSEPKQAQTNIINIDQPLQIFPLIGNDNFDMNNDKQISNKDDTIYIQEYQQLNEEEDQEALKKQNDKINNFFGMFSQVNKDKKVEENIQKFETSLISDLDCSQQQILNITQQQEQNREEIQPYNNNFMNCEQIDEDSQEYSHTNQEYSKYNIENHKNIKSYQQIGHVKSDGSPDPFKKTKIKKHQTQIFNATMQNSVPFENEGKNKKRLSFTFKNMTKSLGNDQYPENVQIQKVRRLKTQFQQQKNLNTAPIRRRSSIQNFKKSIETSIELIGSQNNDIFNENQHYYSSDQSDDGTLKDIRHIKKFSEDCDQIMKDNQTITTVKDVKQCFENLERFRIISKFEWKWGDDDSKQSLNEYKAQMKSKFKGKDQKVSGTTNVKLPSLLQKDFYTAKTLSNFEQNNLSKIYEILSCLTKKMMWNLMGIICFSGFLRIHNYRNTAILQYTVKKILFYRNGIKSNNNINNNLTASMMSHNTNMQSSN